MFNDNDNCSKNMNNKEENVVVQKILNTKGFYLFIYYYTNYYTYYIKKNFV